MPDDASDDFNARYEQATRDAKKLVQDAQAQGLDADFCVKWCRANQERARDLEQKELEIYWERVGRLIATQQKLDDEIAGIVREEDEGINTLWPKYYRQMLDGHDATVYMSGDDFEAFEKRISDAATKMEESARSAGLDTDFAIKWCRINAQHADRHGAGALQKYWKRLGEVLHHRQLDTDEAVCLAAERIEKLDELWPKNYEQALDFNDEGDLGID